MSACLKTALPQAVPFFFVLIVAQLLVDRWRRVNDDRVANAVKRSLCGSQLRRGVHSLESAVGHARKSHGNEPVVFG